VQTQWEGVYLDGRSAARRQAAIHLDPTGLQITIEGGQTVRWPLGQVRQTQGFYAGEEVRLEWGGAEPAALIVADAAFLSALHRLAGERAGHLHNPTSRHRRALITAAASLGALVLVVVLYVWGIPALATVVAARVPLAWEEQLGQTVVEQIAPVADRCTESRRQAMIDEIMTRLTARLPTRIYTFRVLVTSNPAVNAFAAPGGYIVIFRGLLARTSSAEELAGLLAHELQHVVHRHATRALLQQASMGVLIGALSGDFTGTLGFGLDSARTLAALEYSRGLEEEADAEGMRMLLAAGIDPAGMQLFFERLANEEPMPQVFKYLSTHPSPTERVVRLRTLARAPAPPPRRLLPNYAWPDITRICS
jgi:beta-barrel assembly-enhancing protease